MSLTTQDSNAAEPAPAPPATAKQLREVEGKMSSFERSTLRWARAAVILSAVAAAFICGQWLVMRAGGTDTHDLAVAAQTQANGTKELADRMKQQADSTRIIANQAIIQAKANEKLAENAAETLANDRQSFQDEQRAWVGVQNTIGRPPAATTPWAVNVTFFNSGRTPARHVEIATMYKVSPVALTGPPANDIKRLTFRRVESIAPQGTYHLIIGSSPPAETISAFQTQGQEALVARYRSVENGKLFLYYFGILKYDDGFGNEKWTQFCILLANPKTGGVGYCDRFNDLD